MAFLSSVLLTIPLILENVAATLIFCKQERRLTAIRRPLLLIAYVVFAACTTAFARDYSMWPLAVPWILIMLLSMGYARAVCGMPRLESLVVATLGYCLNHLCSDVINAASVLIPGVLGGPQVGVLTPGLRYGVIVPVYALVYLTLGRQFAVDAVKVRSKMHWVLFCAGATVAAIVLQLVFVEGQPSWTKPPLFFYDAVCIVLVMTLLISVSRSDRLQDTLATIDRLWEQERAQYAVTKEKIDLINIKCHDIRKMIGKAAGEAGVLGPETLEEIKDCVRVYDSSAKTGSRALDVLLTDRRLYCSEHQIELTCMADGALLSGVSEDDVYFLMGNVLSNAIEAVERLDEPAQRVINLSVTQAGPMARIYEENYFAGALEFRDGLPVTTKSDRKNHGFGVKSIRHVVEKYHGSMEMGAHGQIFSVSILLPLE